MSSRLFAKLRLQRPGMVATVVSIEYHSYSYSLCGCVGAIFIATHIFQ